MSKPKSVWYKKIVVYRSNYGAPLSLYDRFANWLLYWAAEREKLWAKIIYYPLHWIEQRYYDCVCLIGKHFDHGDGECVRCYKVINSLSKK